MRTQITKKWNSWQCTIRCWNKIQHLRSKEMFHEWINIRSSQRHFICICRDNVSVAIRKNYFCCL